MCERALEQRFPISKVLGNKETTPNRDHRNLDLKPDQWELMSELVHVLKPLKVAKTLVCAEQHVSLSCVYAILVRMRSTLTPTGNELFAIWAMKEKMKNELEVRWKMDTIDTSSPLILSAALDPRFKGLNYLSSTEVLAIREVKSLIAKMCAKDGEKLELDECAIMCEPD